MKSIWKYALVTALALPLAAQQQDGITRQQGDAILDELRQIRQLLEKQAKGGTPQEQTARIKLNLDGFAMLGAKDAPLSVVEFTDYQCPFCESFHVKTFPELKKNFIDNGKVRFYSKDLPLAEMHPNAMRAAMAARCAAEQNGYWTLRDMMGANPGKLDLENILGFATSLKLDAGKLRTCITSEKYKDAVQTDILDAMRIGANGTPTFVVGKSTADGIDGELMVGAQPYTTFLEKLKGLETAK